MQLAKQVKRLSVRYGKPFAAGLTYIMAGSTSERMLNDMLATILEEEGENYQKPYSRLRHDEFHKFFNKHHYRYRRAANWHGFGMVSGFMAAALAELGAVGRWANSGNPDIFIAELSAIGLGQLISRYYERSRKYKLYAENAKTTSSLPSE